MKRILGLLAAVACGITLGAIAHNAVADRNGTGTFSLFTPGNPVTTGTTISSSTFNSTMSDLATNMTDSLSRSGKGGMTAALRGTAGTVSAPAFSYTAETNSGWYRAAASDHRFAVAGVDVVKLTATDLRFDVAGVDVLRLTGTGVTPSQPILAAAGTFGAPSYSWTADPTVGWYRAGSGDIRFALGGIDALQLASGTLTSSMAITSTGIITSNNGLLAKGSGIQVGATGTVIGVINAGTVTLSGGAGTANVGASHLNCMCTDTTAAAAVKCSYANPTLTVAGTGSDVIAYFCF